MVFDRISLIAIYDLLKTINENDGVVSNILMNRSSIYGTKTAPKIQSIQELKLFINENYPYVTWNPDCQCPTCNESVFHLLSFTVHLNNSKHAVFVNKIRNKFESAKEAQLNELSVKACNNLFLFDNVISDLKGAYVCFPYMAQLDLYVDPCDYVEMITNDAYYKVINQYYVKTKRPDFPNMIPYTQLPCANTSFI
jgi:hypothetical protein